MRIVSYIQVLGIRTFSDMDLVRTMILMAAGILLLVASGKAIAKGVEAPVPPQQLYVHAWRLIKDNYYDPKCGGQDWKRWEHRYDGKLSSFDDAHLAIRTMLASLGTPGGEFFPASDFTETKPSSFGLGMKLSLVHERAVVTSVTEASPAYDAGIESGDEILAVDQKPVVGLSPDQILRNTEGKMDSTVQIKWKHSDSLHTAM